MVLANNKLKEAINDLIDFADLTSNKDFRNTLILKNATYVSLKEQEIKNISEKIDLTRNQLINSLLLISDSIEEDLIKGLSDKELILLSPEEKAKFKNSNWAPLNLKSKELHLAVNSLFFLEVYNRQVHLWDLQEVENQEEKGVYSNWIKGKRRFNDYEVVEGSWIKVTRNGEGSVVKLKDDNSLMEYSIHNPSRTWGGEWSLEDGVLILNVKFERSEYQQTIIANREIMNHSGYEVAIYTRDQSLHYFQMLLIKNRNNFW